MIKRFLAKVGGIIFVCECEALLFCCCNKNKESVCSAASREIASVGPALPEVVFIS